MAEAAGGQAHRLGREAIQTCWDNALPPQLTIAPGDTVTFETLEPTWGNVARNIAAGELPDLDPDLRALVIADTFPEPDRNTPATAMRGHALTGPTFIEGAEPGDVLVIDILAITPATWGWTGAGGGRGLLPEAFPEYRLHLWDLRRKTETPFITATGDLRAIVPLAPFCGVMGVAPATPGQFRTAPPTVAGGNMDIRQLTAGARLHLPVFVPGALFSVGDVHAAQGDGEVSETAIETSATVTLRFDLLKGKPLATPEFITPDAGARSGPSYAVTAHDPDLLAAAREALRGMLRYLSREHGMDEQDAYILASVCVDLRISQAVNADIYTVTAFVPLSIFDLSERSATA